MSIHNHRRHHQVLIFLCFTFLLPFNGFSQSPTTTNPEHTILLNLKNHWLNPSSLSHWTPSSDHCTWPEITCSDGNGSITGLKIVDKNISQTIPSFICDLKNLTSIDLNLNYIPGSFPRVLYNCSMLEYLDLSKNYFVGPIPDDVSRLSSRLKFLNLGSNNFTGDIPPAIGSLPELRNLQLIGNLFNGSFPPEIGNLVNLEELQMGFNNFAPQALPSSFTQLKKLRILWFTESTLVGEIPQGIGNMSALESLDLSINGLTGNIPDGLFLLKKLENLYLYKNRLTGAIPRTIEALSLKILDLSSNNLTGTIPEDFGKLTSLTGLALFFNQLSGEVPVSVGSLPSLVDFGVFSNDLSGELPSDLGRFSRLETFQVASNRFFGTLPKYLCHNGVLRGLVVFDNNLTGELPEFLGDCNTLKVVRLYGNRFSGEIPRGLWTSFNLTTLMLSDNLFTGQLPEKIASNLSLLELSNNRFSGGIPVGISSWKSLRVFKGSNNSFTGEIPREMTDLPLLTTILLDHNQLSGKLPSDIVSWKALTTLNLSSNEISGEIPSELGHLPDLVYLDLSKNELSGEVPPELGRLRLPSLNLSSNRLSGRIPFEFENRAFDHSFMDNPNLCASTSFLGLKSCVVETRKSNKFSSGVILAVSIAVALGFLVAFVYTIFVLRTCRKRKNLLHSTWKLTPFQKLNFSESNILSRLTNDNMIGCGGSGEVFCVPVYSTGEYVAVKRIHNSKNMDHKLEKEFHAEVEILGQIRHSNIVKLLCCISSDESKLLVYEYMSNHSLDKWIHAKRRESTFSGPVHRAVLDWPKRLHIAVGAARGLCYMHHDNSPPIIHRDVKSSNVLLDSEFNAKIADFGLARMLVKLGQTDTMSAVAGSFGYIAPEYAKTTRVNEKIDVFGFGVILLELVTGREGHEGDENSSLSEWAWRHFQEGKPISEALDEDIKDPVYLDDMKSVFKLGIICTGIYPSIRPTMKDVLNILLRCSHSQHLREKSHETEHDFHPLLRNSKVERRLEVDNSDPSSVLII